MTFDCFDFNWFNFIEYLIKFQAIFNGWWNQVAIIARIGKWSADLMLDICFKCKHVLFWAYLKMEGPFPTKRHTKCWRNVFFNVKSLGKHSSWMFLKQIFGYRRQRTWSSLKDGKWRTSEHLLKKVQTETVSKMSLKLPRNVLKEGKLLCNEKRNWHFTSGFLIFPPPALQIGNSGFL